MEASYRKPTAEAAGFTVDVLPQAALRFHAVNCTQPLQGCITICFLLVHIPNSRNYYDVCLLFANFECLNNKIILLCKMCRRKL